MKNFEAVVLFTPDLSDSNLNKEKGNFEKNLSEMGGKLVNQENWGLRNLSYNIQGNKKSFYFFYQIKFESDKIQEIKKILNQNEKILRYLFIKVNDHQKLPTKILEGKSQNE